MKFVYFFFVLVSLFACKSDTVKLVQAFNGRVTINTIGFGNPSIKLAESLTFIIKIPLEIENIVNNNKKIVFTKEEINSIKLGFVVSDSLGRNLIPDKDFKINQPFTAFTGEYIYPSWRENSKMFEAQFSITFLTIGNYKISTGSNTLILNQNNFLLREKKISTDFDVKSRNIYLLKNHFPKINDFELSLISDNPEQDKNKTINGFLLINVL